MKQPINPDNKFIPIFELLPSIAHTILQQLDNLSAVSDKMIPYHLNNLIFTADIPNSDLQATFTFTRTRFGKSLKYNQQDILDYYKRLAVTIGKPHANRVYHVNYRRFKGEIVPLKMDINRIVQIDEIHDCFPDLTIDNILAINTDNLSTDEKYPTHFVL